MRGNQDRILESLRTHLAQRKPLRPDSLWSEYDIVIFTDCKHPPDPGASYRDRLALDATLVGLRGVVCEATLPDLHSCLHSFLFTDLQGINSDPLRHLLTKAWPLRCWSRKFGEVTTKYIQKYPHIAAFMNQVTMCSLLANYDYPHACSAESIPSKPETRKAIYRAFTTETELRDKILKHVPRVYMYALQQFICFLVRQNPSMERHVQHTFDFAKFEQLITKVNQKLRKHFVRHVEGDMFEDTTARMQQEVKEIITPILRTSYQKSKPLFLDYLTDVRSAVKAASANWVQPGYEIQVMRRADYVKPSTLLSMKDTEEKKKKKDEEDDDEDGEDAEKRAKRQAQEIPLEDAPTLLALQNDKKGLQSLAASVVINEERQKQQQQQQRTDGKQVITVTGMHITKHHSDQIDQLLQRMDPFLTSSDTVLETFLSCLSAFGSPLSAVSAIRSLWNDYQRYNHAKVKWIALLNEFNQRFPYTYCLLQALRRLWTRQKEVQLFSLPGDSARSQIQALQQQLKLCSHAGVPYEGLFFSFCKACQSISSLVQSHKSSHKQNDTEGKRKIIHDLDTNLSYCSEKKVFAHKSCEDSPLAHLMLIGRTVLLQRRFYMFCCQENCRGRVMQFDSGRVLFNDAGVACTTCTRRIMAQQHSDFRKRIPHLQDKEKKCTLCWKSISSQSTTKKTEDKQVKEELKKPEQQQPKKKEVEKPDRKTYYLYGLGTYVCSRHADALLNKLHEAVISQLTKEQQEQAFQDKAIASQVQALLEKEYKKLKLEFSSSELSFNQSKKNKAILNALKTTTAAVRGGHSS